MTFPLGRYDLPAPWLKEPFEAEKTETDRLDESAEVAFERVTWVHRDCEKNGKCDPMRQGRERSLCTRGE